MKQPTPAKPISDLVMDIVKAACEIVDYDPDGDCSRHFEAMELAVHAYRARLRKDGAPPKDAKR